MPYVLPNNSPCMEAGECFENECEEVSAGWDMPTRQPRVITSMAPGPRGHNRILGAVRTGGREEIPVTAGRVLQPRSCAPDSPRVHPRLHICWCAATPQASACCQEAHALRTAEGKTHSTVEMHAHKEHDYEEPDSNRMTGSLPCTTWAASSGLEANLQFCRIL